MKLIIFIIIILQYSYLNAEEYKFSPSIILEHNIIKVKDGGEKESIFKIELPTKLFYNRLELSVYPIVEYNLSQQKYKDRFRKAYLSYLIGDSIYIGVGRQPIIWGVGRGKNPTNFLKNLKLLEKYQKPYVVEEGTDCVIVTLSKEDFSLENICSFSKSFKDIDAYALKLKGVFNNWDIALPFYIDLKNKETRFGFDLEGDIGGLFNLYSEVAFHKRLENYQGIVGLSKLLSLTYNINIDIEYFNAKDEKERYIYLQLSAYPTEEFRGLFILGYDEIEKNIFFMPNISLYFIKNIEVGFIPTFYLNNNNRPFEHIITGRFTYWF